ncbi:MAG: hypothetical protein R3Y28_08550, partial [Candidatus Gastranaerophilales bacterium]
TCDGQSEWDSDFKSGAVYPGDTNYDMGTSCSTNYWAGALKACDDADKRLPTLSELAYLAQYLYDLDYTPGDTAGVSDIVFNETKMNELSMTFKGSGVGTYRYWSNQSSGDVTAYHRYFSSTNIMVDGSATEASSYIDNFKSYSAITARCVR